MNSSVVSSAFVPPREAVGGTAFSVRIGKIEYEVKDRERHHTLIKALNPLKYHSEPPIWNPGDLTHPKVFGLWPEDSQGDQRGGAKRRECLLCMPVRLSHWFLLRMEEDGMQMTAHRVYRIEKHSMEDYPVGLDNFRPSHDRTLLENSGDLDPGPRLGEGRWSHTVSTPFRRFTRYTLGSTNLSVCHPFSRVPGRVQLQFYPYLPNRSNLRISVRLYI